MSKTITDYEAEIKELKQHIVHLESYIMANARTSMYEINKLSQEKLKSRKLSKSDIDRISNSMVL